MFQIQHAPRWQILETLCIESLCLEEMPLWRIWPGRQYAQGDTISRMTLNPKKQLHETQWGQKSNGIKRGQTGSNGVKQGQTVSNGVKQGKQGITRLNGVIQGSTGLNRVKRGKTGLNEVKRG